MPTIIAQLLGLRGDPMVTESYVRCFDDIRLTDIPEVGAKNASLGELHAMLAAKAGRVPDGFALIANAHREALATDDVEKKLRRLLADFDHRNVSLLAERAAAVRRLVYEATGNAKLRAQIATAYHELETKCGKPVAVAVRSSATAEDLPSASFEVYVMCEIPNNVHPD